MDGYVTGGPVPPDSNAYVARSTDDVAHAELSAGHWVVLLAPRQQGKSSALLRLQRRLEDEGIRCVVIDMQAYGANGTYQELLEWICKEIAAHVDIEQVSVPDRGREDLESWLRGVLGDIPNLVVVLDETSAVPEAHQRRFFGQLRALYNRRASDDVDAASRRIQIAFAGTFRPERLIDSPNSPFNISHDVIVDDLSVEEASQLARDVSGEQLVEFATRAYEVVGGQPYLLQTLLAAADRGSDRDDRERRFVHAMNALRARRNSHVTFLFELIKRDEQLLRVVRELLEAGGRMPYRAGDADHDFAYVSGIARLEGEDLCIRNALYAELAEAVFGDSAQAAGELAPETETAVDVLLVTATSVETRAVREVFLGEGETPELLFGRNNSYLDLGVASGRTVALVEIPSAGSGGPTGAALTVAEAVRELEPSSVILVGIAFGVDPETQEIGEVFISQQIENYELQRVGPGPEIRMRGDRVTASPRLLGLMQTAQQTWDEPLANGLLLSGEKLIDQRDFRDELTAIAPDALGGEMEGAGVYAAAARSGVEWIVVKACCDFADGNKRADVGQRQAIAAERAAGFVHLALNLGGREI